MKLQYTTPRISVEALEKADVLLASTVTPTDPVTQKRERENQYGDFMSFVFNPANWFD